MSPVNLITGSLADVEALLALIFHICGEKQHIIKCPMCPLMKLYSLHHDKHLILRLEFPLLSDRVRMCLCTCKPHLWLRNMLNTKASALITSTHPPTTVLLPTSRPAEEKKGWVGDRGGWRFGFLCHWLFIFCDAFQRTNKWRAPSHEAEHVPVSKSKHKQRNES